MKKIFLFLIVVASVYTAKAQTADETINWLNSKLPPYRFNELVAKHTIFSHKEWKLAYAWYGDMSGITASFRIRPQYITNITSQKENGKTVFIITAKDETIQYDDTPHAKLEFVTSAKFCLDLADETEAAKILKALKHLATEEGAKLLNDDLFK